MARIDQSGKYEGSRAIGELIADIGRGEEADNALFHGHSDLLTGYHPVFGQIVEEARDLLRHGLREEAVARLRLITAPKWASRRDCLKRYARHMAAQRARARNPGDYP